MRDRDVRLPRPRKTRAAYQGPSWSSLGINGPVHFFDAKELHEDGAQIKMGYLGHEVISSMMLPRTGAWSLLVWW